MGYLIDRDQVVWEGELVAVLKLRHRGVRSHLLLTDGSARRTLTLPGRLIRTLQQREDRHKGLAWINERQKRPAK